MGYDTYVTGSLTVTPKLSERQIADLRLDEDDGDELVAQSGGEDDTVGVVDGELTVIPGKSFTLITCRYEEPFRAGGLSETFVEAFTKIVKAGHKVEGALYGAGEEFPDAWRLRVDNGKPVHETPEFLWPDGTKGWGV